MVELKIPEWYVDTSMPILNQEQTSDLAKLIELPIALEEKALMHDLFSCLIGGEGQYIKQNADKKYRLHCIARASASGFVEKLIPMCDHFIYIQEFGEKHYELKHGRILHALAAAFRHFCFDYVQKIADLETYPRLTLALMITDLRTSAEMLDVGASLIQVIEENNLKGVPITSVIYDTLASLRGSLYLRNFLSFLFEKSVVPIVNFVEKWVFSGEIDDPVEEFFIKAIIKSSHIDRIKDAFCDNRFTIVEAKVPKFIPSTVIERIFAAGKVQSVLFSCGKRDTGKARHLTLNDLQFEAPLAEAYEKSSTVLINMFINEYDFMNCIRTLQKIFLCQRGDWLDSFMQVAGRSLRRPREQISSQDFDHIIRSIFDPKYHKYVKVSIEDTQLPAALQEVHSFGTTQERQAKPISSSNSKSQWEYFAFKPVIPEPLNLVITVAAQQKYTFLFRHILSWRRLERTLGHTLKIPQIKEISVARHAMQIFVASYLNYMFHVIIHPSWEQFSKKLETIRNIEELKIIHEKLLTNLLKGCFLLNVNIYKRMTYIASTCWHFAKELKKWHHSVSNDFTDDDKKRNLAKPLIEYYKKFMKSVSKCMEEITSQSAREVDQSYIDFLLLLTMNNCFSNYSD